MKFVIQLLCAAFAGSVFADCNESHELSIPAVKNPVLAVSGYKKEDFIPVGWKLADSVTDDFNRDKRDDFAIAIVENNPKNIIKNECGLGAETIDTNPYAILVALKRKDNGYNLLASDFGIIPRLNDPVLDQPYSGIAAKKGVLSVNYHFWQSAGSWSASDQAFKFKFQNNCMRLIGHEYHWLHRASGEESGTSSNFITGSYIISNQNPDNKHLRKRKYKLKNNPVYCLGNVPKEFEHIKY